MADLATCSAEQLLALLERSLVAEAQAFLHARSFGKTTTVQDALMGARITLHENGIHDPEIIRGFLALERA